MRNLLGYDYAYISIVLEGGLSSEESAAHNPEYLIHSHSRCASRLGRQECSVIDSITYMYYGLCLCVKVR